MTKIKYNTVTIEAGRSGWAVKESGRPLEVFIRWESLVDYISSRLTSRGDEDFKVSLQKKV